MLYLACQFKFGIMQNKLIIILIHFLLLLFNNRITAQQLSNVKVFGIEQGLSSRNVLTTFEAKDGFLWVGTVAGLSRFDGETFVPFKLLDAQSELAYLSVNGIIEKGNNLWITTDEGLFILNTITYHVRKIQLPGIKTKSVKLSVIYELKDGRIAIGSYQSLCWIAKNEFEITPITNEYNPSGKFSPMLSFVEDDQQNLWFTTSFDEIYAIGLKNNSVKYYQKSNQNVDKLYFHKQYGLIVLSEKTFKKVDTITHTLKANLPNYFKDAIDLFFEKDNSAWILKKSLDFIYHTEKSNATFYDVFDQLNEQTIRINTIHKSKKHFWIATNNGIVKASFSQFRIEQFFNHSLIKANQENRSVRGMTEDENKNLYFASYLGLYKLPFPYTIKQPIPLYIDSVKNYIPFALAYEKGKIWIGSEGGSLGLYDLKTKKLKVFNADPTIRSNRFVISLLNEKDRLLLGTYGGLYYFDKKTSKLKPFELIFQQKNFNDASISQVLKFKNNYWLATNKGLLKCDAQMHIVALFNFKNQAITTIIRDSLNNCFWLGTLGDGLFQFSENVIYKNYNFQDGLADNRIVGLSLQENKIYIATYFGLSCFNITAKTFTNFHTDQGLTHNEFNTGATFLSSEKKLFMGGINGYNLIDFKLSDYTKQNTQSPFIASFYTLNGKVEHKIYSNFSQEIRKIPSNNTVIEFEFGLTDFNQPEKNRYAYKLDGVDKDWVFIGNRNYLRLINLAAGKYTLHLKAAGSNGNWMEMKNTITFEKTPIFYQTKWFFAMVSLGIISLIILFAYLKINRMKTIHQLRMQISSDLHDEVGGVLTAVGMQAELLKGSNLENKSEQLNKISNLSREAVSTMRDVIWSIDTQNERFVNLIDRMNEYLNLIFEDTAIVVDFKHAISNSNEFVDLITKQNTYLIFKEAINNIVKHANSQNVKVRLQVKDNVLNLIIISDGIAKMAVQQGMGLKNMHSRAHKMNADLRIDLLNNYELHLTKYL